jgi:hypothetical protein
MYDVHTSHKVVPNSEAIEKLPVSLFFCDSYFIAEHPHVKFNKWFLCSISLIFLSFQGFRSVDIVSVK